MDERTTRKRVQETNSHLDVGNKRQRSISPSPAHTSYPGVREAQGATTRVAAGISPPPPHPHPHPLPPDTNTFGDDDCQAWGGLNRFNEAMSLGPSTNWDQHQYEALAATATLGFAVPSHNINPHFAPPLANVPQHGSMSYTGVHAHAHANAQPMNALGHFAPVATVAGFNNGFTGGDFIAYPHEPLHSSTFPPWIRYNEPLYEETQEPPLDPTVVNHHGRPTNVVGRSGPRGYTAALGDRRRADRIRRIRGRLCNKDREETKNTRQLRACIRCRFQRIRCIPDPSKAETEYCVCCKKVLSLETKKVIHRIPCLRWRLNDIVLFRVGGLELTKRWKGVSVQNLRLGDWADERVVTISICITTLLCKPLSLNVRRFRPCSNDTLYRHWKRKDTDPPMVINLPSYALADVNATSLEYQQFIEQNAEEAIRRFTNDPTVNEIVRWTFSVALSHCNKMADKDLNTKGNPVKLFTSYFRLWFAARFSMGSAYITNGHENLEGNAYPPMYHGKHYIPRMITAQFDSIGYKDVLADLRKKVLDELWVLMQKRRSKTFFSVYLTVFMMLYEITVTCQDRHRRAKEQGLKTYYDLEEVVANLKLGADILLAHWHYYKTDIDPLALHEDAVARYFGPDNPEEVNLLMKTCQKYSDMEEKPLSQVGWEQDPLQLASRMFEQDWKPFHFHNRGP
ncbi:hypothetical protein F5Y09DRAFT_37618 [Xylaria sp. FL1042]|nr:hypothetical protein F5Y09DRAFT_37618 [Xylaria sp. FL1042]